MKIIKKTQQKFDTVRMKIIQPIVCEWICPECRKVNYETYYAAPGRTRVKCHYCKKTFFASR